MGKGSNESDEPSTETGIRRHSKTLLDSKTHISSLASTAPRIPHRGKYSSDIEEQMVALFVPPPLGSSNKNGGIASKLDAIEVAFLNAGIVAAPNVSEKEMIELFDKTSMSVDPQDAETYLAAVCENVVANSIHCAAPTMIGHMTTSLPFYMRYLSKLLTTIHSNNVKIETAKATTFMEKEAMAMLHRAMFKFGDRFYETHAKRADAVLGVVCSGGTIANTSAMWIARNKLFKPDGDYMGCDKQGVVKGMLHYKYTGAVIIGSEVMHYSMKKAADVLGLGTEGLMTCPFNKDYQVDLAVMRSSIEHCRKNNIAILSLVGVAGGTETGSIDDLNAIADLAEEFDLHFHVDAAWGGPVMFSSSKAKIAGIERADTVTLDGHKQLYTPMGCGLCFLRNPDQIHTVQKTANYIIRKESYDLGKFTMEGSRPAVAMFLHANLEIMGIKGLGAIVDRCIRHTSYMVTALRATGQFEECLVPMTNILLYRYIPKAFRGKGKCTEKENAEFDRINVALQSAQKLKGSTFVSRTTIYSPVQKCRVVALRVVIANPLTCETHIDLTLADQLEIVSRIDV